MNSKTTRQRKSRRRMRSTTTNSLMFVPMMMVLNMAAATTNTRTLTRHSRAIFNPKPDHRQLGTHGNRLQWGDDDVSYAEYNNFDYNGQKDADGNPIVSTISEEDATTFETNSPDSPRTIVIDWFVPSNQDGYYPDQEAVPGDVIVFNFNPIGNHDVYIHPSGDCDREGAILIAAKGTGTGSYTFVASEINTSVFFTSHGPSHCPFGQFINVNVVEELNGTASGATPIPSPGPTRSPTPKPSLTLTLAPTKFPTQLPTVPPTWILTRSPTKGPSFPPTPPPPTDSPIVASTKSPTPGPTRVPTLPPTPNPTPPPSPGPTKQPTPFPTGPPTKLPTPPPTIRPTDLPTKAPTVPPTEAPTTAVQTQYGINGTRITECSSPPLGEGFSNVQLLAFEYNLYLPLTPMVAVQASASDRVSNAVAIMEQRIHNGLVAEFLDCDTTPNDAVLAETLESFRVTAVMSAPIDQVNGTKACDTSNDPDTDISTECFVVVAQLSLDAFFPSSSTRRFLRRLQLTLANSDVLDSVGTYLNTSMTNDDFIGTQDGDDSNIPEEDRIVQVSFQGFLNVLTTTDDDDGTTSGSGVNNAEGVGIRSGGDKNESNVFLLGTVAFGGGALLLFLVALFATRRNRSRQEAYLRQLDDLAADSEVSSQASHILADGKVHLVRDEDYDRFEVDEDAIEMELPASHSNVHFCSSATCPICKHRVMGPTFVSTGLSQTNSFEDLSPRKKPLGPNGRHYEASDTVAL